MSNPDDPAAWVAKAQSDLLCIENNLSAAEVPWDAVCFHAHQAAEKMLKALLISQGAAPARTHDLGALLGESVAQGAPLAALQADCDFLNLYAVASRYPGAGPEPTESVGRRAIAAAKRVHQAVLPLLQKGGGDE